MQSPLQPCQTWCSQTFPAHAGKERESKCCHRSRQIIPARRESSLGASLSPAARCQQRPERPGLAPMTSSAFSSPSPSPRRLSPSSLPTACPSSSPSFAIHRGNCGCAVTSVPPSKERKAYSLLFLSIFVSFVSLLWSESQFRLRPAHHFPLFVVASFRNIKRDVNLFLWQ